MRGGERKGEKELKEESKIIQNFQLKVYMVGGARTFSEISSAKSLL